MFKMTMVGPVMLSSRGGYIDCVKTLISYGADLDLASCKDGRTALWAATSGGHVDCVTELILHGADVNAQPQLCMQVLLNIHDVAYRRTSFSNRAILTFSVCTASCRRDISNSFLL